MGIIRPATPGFLVTLVATALLAVVSFCVPYFKSVYFLKANISIGGNNGSITFGTLGYCLQLANGTTCSSPAVGYQLDINSLVGNELPVEIPQVVVKWLTYCLVLHIVALGLSAGSALFGLLAHVREMSMTCCSTCVSGLAAAVALLAFIFDIAIFFAARARINAVGSAEIGNATWLTLAAWILLFFSGCFYTLGRCCYSRRQPRKGQWDNSKGSGVGGLGGGSTADQLRLDAVKAEAERKARQKDVEVGLPAFHEIQPLAARVDGDKVYLDDDHDASYGGRPANGGGYSGGGYVQAPVGSRAVDEYYSPTRTNFPPSTYPPAPQQGTGYAVAGYGQNNTPKPASPPQQNPRRQDSGYAQSQYAQSTYAPSTYAYNSPTPAPATNQYLSTAPGQYGNDRYASPGREYGHTAAGTSYHTAASHEQEPSSYSAYDPYESHQPTNNAAYNNFNNNSLLTSPPIPSTSYPTNQYYPTQPSQVQSQPERSYTLGGDRYTGNGYGQNSLPPLAEHEGSYFPQSTTTPPAPINTNTGYVVPPQTSPVKGPRSQTQLTVRNEVDDSPPDYDAGSSNIQGAWGKR
ncbi:pH-response regulator protein palI/prr-5 [Hypsizygus marmoreus]|uniref:PH-response regulator protein palI/prr-5 n=1 Tax=Hypsizygus marmoreus TaxID=39966 RepID=A0A369KAE7_HYPMA|nr:pH-response regulator protein palI/prr-5 [Hypsizygus marmoreus]